MPDKITVSIILQVDATWSPDLTGDAEYPTIHTYVARVREQIAADPLAAISKLPDPKVSNVHSIVWPL